METKTKIPRKLKKALKLMILKGKDSSWRTSEVRIDRFESLPKHRLDGWRKHGGIILNNKMVTQHRMLPR